MDFTKQGMADMDKQGMIGAALFNGTLLNAFPGQYAGLGVPPLVDTARLEALRLATANPHWTPAEIVEAAKVYFAFLTGAQPASGGG